jgi:hypothetical protein
MNKINDLTRHLPAGGIVAFSLCSTHSVYQSLTANAQHPTALFWLPAVLVELVTAWIVHQVVRQVRQVTRSNISKQDRRFYTIMLIAFVILAIPTLGVSVWANAVEFSNVLLGLLFPVASMACAVGAALPQTVETYRKQTEADRKEAAARRKASEAQRKQAAIEAEARRKEAETERKAAETQRQLLANLGPVLDTVRAYSERPHAPQAEIAGMLDISARTVRNHLARAEAEGVIKRNGNGVELLVELE